MQVSTLETLYTSYSACDDLHIAAGLSVKYSGAFSGNNVESSYIHQYCPISKSHV